MICFLSSLFVVVGSAIALPPHPNHVTLAEMEFNPKSGNFEVSLCVWPEDLEAVLKILQQGEDPQSALRLEEEIIARVIPKYLESRFNLRDDDRNKKPCLPIRWVGCELDGKKAWLFFEIKSECNESPATNVMGQNWVLENRLFFELYDDQINHVKIKHGTSVTWHQAAKRIPTVEFVLAPEH